MFHNVPGVPRGKMERFAGVYSAKRNFVSGAGDTIY